MIRRTIAVVSVVVSACDNGGGGALLPDALADAASTSVQFLPQALYGTGAGGPFELRAGDLNNDGNVDLAVANNLGSGLATLRNNGDGTFAAAVVVPTGMYVSTLQIANLDGDSALDLIDDTALHLNNGDGTFGAAIDYGGIGVSLRTADLNGDGMLDIALSRPGIFAVHVLLGMGNGTFAAPNTNVVASTYTSSYVLADMNGDGKQDVVSTVTGNSANPRRAVAVALGTGTGEFGSFRETELGITDPVGLAAGDLDGDGNVDIVASSTTSKAFVPARGRGDGGFDTPVMYSLPGTWNISAAVADLNADGRLDVLVTHGLDKRVGVFLNRGDGILVADTPLATDEEPVFVTTADLNKDGRLDVIVTNRKQVDVTGAFGTISVLLQQ